MERTYSCKLRSLAACTRAARLLPLRYSGPSALSCPLFTLLPRRKILRRRPKAPRCSLMAAFLISDNACYPASWRVAFTCEALKTVAINRTQVLVLSFFGLVWTSLVILFAAAPEVYGRALGLSSAHARLLFLVAISVFIALLGMGVIRRWRWTFWLILVAFVFGPLRVVASVLALGGVLPADGPTWYVLYQALLGALQFAVALFMLAGYRRDGTWGAF